MGNNNIQIDDYLSEHFEITFGVPQGSILGPVLFNFYVNDLSYALPSTVKCHQYADDTTFYRHCKPSEFQNCNAAGFVLGRYANKLDVYSSCMGWLPINERRENHLLHTVFKALYFNNWPSYLKLDIHKSGRTLRSSTKQASKVPLDLGTFQGSASKIFNILPSTVKNSAVFNDFKTQVKMYLKNKATVRLNA